MLTWLFQTPAILNYFSFPQWHPAVSDFHGLVNFQHIKKNFSICNCYLKFFRSSQGSPDWTCIVAGFTSGYMRIYLQVHLQPLYSCVKSILITDQPIDPLVRNFPKWHFCTTQAYFWLFPQGIAAKPHKLHLQISLLLL